MITVKLKEAIEEYKRAKGIRRFTYADLRDVAGVSYGTLDAIANREGYSPSFDTLDKLCRALETTPADILAFDPRSAQAKPGKKGEGPKPSKSAKRNAKKKRAKRKAPSGRNKKR